MLPWAGAVLALANLNCAQTRSANDEEAPQQQQPDDSSSVRDGQGSGGRSVSDSGASTGMSAAQASDATVGRGDGAMPDARATADAATLPPPPRIPVIDAECPLLATGSVNVLGKEVRVWVGEPRDDVAGAILMYWHASGPEPDEASRALGQNIDRVTAEGGIVAAFTETLGTGELTSPNWYTGDFAMADVLVACAVEQLHIDTRRIYTSGCSAGGLQVGMMVYARASYLAAAIAMSGGA
jgi:hypothetical protein